MILTDSLTFHDICLKTSKHTKDAKANSHLGQSGVHGFPRIRFGVQGIY